jgi:hypothetical protein
VRGKVAGNALQPAQLRFSGTLVRFRASNINSEQRLLRFLRSYLIAMNSGFKPADAGEPATEVNTPVAAFSVNSEMFAD